MRSLAIRLGALVLALAMVFGFMATSAFAANTPAPTKDVTLNARLTGVSSLSATGHDFAPISIKGDVVQHPSTNVDLVAVHTGGGAWSIQVSGSIYSDTDFPQTDFSAPSITATGLNLGNLTGYGPVHVTSPATTAKIADTADARGTYAIPSSVSFNVNPNATAGGYSGVITYAMVEG